MTGRDANSHDYDRQSLIGYLLDASDTLGESPSQRQFNNLDGFPSTQPYNTTFGSWGEAKAAAGMEASDVGWEKRSEETKIGVYRDELSNSKCRLCPESSDCALTFHHPSGVEKREHVSQMRQSSVWSAEDIKDEIEKCVVLCANCHSKIHSDSHPLEVDE